MRPKWTKKINKIVSFYTKKENFRTKYEKIWYIQASKNTSELCKHDRENLVP